MACALFRHHILVPLEKNAINTGIDKTEKRYFDYNNQRKYGALHFSILKRGTPYFYK